MIHVNEFWELDFFSDSFLQYMYTLSEENKNLHNEELEFIFENVFKETIYYKLINKNMWEYVLQKKTLKYGYVTGIEYKFKHNHLNEKAWMKEIFFFHVFLFYHSPFLSKV